MCGCTSPDFNTCVRKTADACARKDCADRFRANLDVDPYASSLRVVGETSEEACASARSEKAYTAFNHCLAQSPECNRESCVATLPASVRDGPHEAEISAALQTAHDLCAETKAFADFNACIAQAPACDRVKCGDSLAARSWSGPHGREYSAAIQAARDACAEETAYSAFSRCMIGTDVCARTACGAGLTNGTRNGRHSGEIAEALDAAERECAARRSAEISPPPPIPAPQPPPTPAPQPPPIPAPQPAPIPLPLSEPLVRPSFDCNRATHSAEYAICDDSDLARLDQALAQAFNERRSILSGEPLRQLIRTEDRWVGYRNSVCNGLSGLAAKSCLIPIIQARISDLRGY